MERLKDFFFNCLKKKVNKSIKIVVHVVCLAHSLPNLSVCLKAPRKSCDMLPNMSTWSSFHFCRNADISVGMRLSTVQQSPSLSTCISAEKHYTAFPPTTDFWCSPNKWPVSGDCIKCLAIWRGTSDDVYVPPPQKKKKKKNLLACQVIVTIGDSGLCC